MRSIHVQLEHRLTLDTGNEYLQARNQMNTSGWETGEYLQEYQRIQSRKPVVREKAVTGILMGVICLPQSHVVLD